MNNKALKVLAQMKILNAALNELLEDDLQNDLDAYVVEQIEEYAKSTRFKMLWLGVKA